MKYIAYILLCCLPLAGFNQSFSVIDGDTVNIIDQNMLKQGDWVVLAKMRKLPGFEPDQLVESGKYKDDKRIGLWKYYDFNGKIEHKSFYLNGIDTTGYDTSRYKEVSIDRDIRNERLKEEIGRSKLFQTNAKLEKDNLTRINEEQVRELYVEKLIKYILGGLMVFLILVIIFVYQMLKRIKSAKQMIEKQKQVVEEAHREIKDSIAYAKRIQTAILPQNKVVKEYLKDSFILYKPKDIVAGDFYWMEQVSGKVLFAACDCTGHGVPGAMVSVVCNNSLNRSVREFGLTDPGEILDKTREIVIQEFEKSEDDVKDGMDIALCSIDGMVLKYAGANNPLWIIRDNKILETKATKQPIGKCENKTPYTTHTFDLAIADTLYIFTDGYVDQFGGEKGKKFKAKAFGQLLLSIQDKSMEEQKILINEVFEHWMGDVEQVDDVCVIGIRV